MRGNAHPMSFLVAGCWFSCGAELPSPSRIDSLRLLALVTDTPEVLSGSGATLRAVWFDPDQRPARFLWRVCPEPADGDARACARPEGGASRVVSSDDTLALSPGEIALPAGSTSATWIVYVALCSDLDPVYTVSLGHARCGARDAIESVRRVTVRAAPPLNQNPGIARVSVGSLVQPVELSPRTVLPACNGACDGWTVALDPAADAAESGEVLMVSFYATAGRFEVPRALGSPGVASRLSTVWRPAGAASGSEVSMWLVLRDQRGGESFRRGAVLVP